MIAQPQDFGRAVGRADAMSADTIDGVRITGGGDGVGLGLGALIGPDDTRAQRGAIAAQRHTAHHLAAKGDRGDGRGGDAGLVQQLAGRCANGVPPVGRVLLGPVGMGIGGGVRSRSAADQHAVRIEQAGLIAGRAQVVGQDQGWMRHTGVSIAPADLH